LASQALALDPNYALAHRAQGGKLLLQGRLDESVVENERALTLDPSLAMAVGAFGSDYMFLGQFEKSLEFFDKAIRLSPHDPNVAFWHQLKAVGFIGLKQYDLAIETLRWSLAINPNNFWAHYSLIAALALAGLETEAREALGIYLGSVPSGPRTMEAWKAAEAPFIFPSTDPRYLEVTAKEFNVLRRAGMPEE
jgi:adenylate cyclase